MATHIKRDGCPRALGSKHCPHDPGECRTAPSPNRQSAANDAEGRGTPTDSARTSARRDQKGKTVFSAGWTGMLFAVRQPRQPLSRGLGRILQTWAGRSETASERSNTTFMAIRLTGEPSSLISIPGRESSKTGICLVGFAASVRISSQMTANGGWKEKCWPVGSTRSEKGRTSYCYRVWCRKMGN